MAGLKNFDPDGIFSDFTRITPEMLIKEDIKGILTDLDDTLVGHNNPVPTEELGRWLSEMKKSGIKVCIISNNKKARVKPFAEKIGVGYFCNAFKPRPYFYHKGLEVLNIKKNECVVIGDQLFTDIKGAKLCGIKAYLVTPVGNKATLFIKFKRLFEKRRNL